MTLRLVLLMSVASLLAYQFLSAQDREREGGDRGRSRFDPTEILKRLDRNGNGSIDPDEMQDERTKRFVGEMARRVNLDPAQAMPIDKLTAGAEQFRSSSAPSSGSPSNDSSRDSDRDRDRDRRDSDRDRDRDRDRNRSSSSTPPTPAVPSVMGFGVAATTVPKAVGFDVPLSVDATIPLEKRYDARVIEYVDNMLREQDKNKDGYIDNIEWKAGRWSTPPEESDTNKDGRLSKAELCERIARRFGLTNPPAGSSTTSSSGSSSGSPSSSSSSGDVAKFKQYAESLIRQFDKNRNGMLERDEWSEMKSEHRSADTNGDGVITLDELTAKLQSYSSGTSSYGSKSPAPGSSTERRSWFNKGSTTASNSGDKKGYRFTTPTERLPKGLPDWFLRNDTDGDGQIAMVEFASTWTDQMAADFQKYDLNNDGFITPEECLAAGRSK